MLAHRALLWDARGIVGLGGGIIAAIAGIGAGTTVSRIGADSAVPLIEAAVPCVVVWAEIGAIGAVAAPIATELTGCVVVVCPVVVMVDLDLGLAIWACVSCSSRCSGRSCCDDVSVVVSLQAIVCAGAVHAARGIG